MSTPLWLICRALSLSIFGAVLINAQPNGSASAAVQGPLCIDQGLTVTRDNDSALFRARAFLELPAVRFGVVQALHLTLVGQQPLPTRVGCVSFGGAHESGAGAEITYRYGWKTLLEEGSNDVTFHCDPTGHIDRLRVATSTNKPFAEFGDYLKDREGDAIKYFVKQITAPDGSKQEDESSKQARDFFAEIVAFVVQQTVGVDPQRVAELAVGEFYDLHYRSSGLPAYGMDGFLFGLGETPAFRHIAIGRSELRTAIQKVTAISIIAGSLHDSGGYEAEADEIARVADTCAQITAHDAFSVTIGGNRGTENLASLNPALNVCNGAPMTTHVIPGAAATRTRPILFSLSPAGRGWRDAKGMLVQLWFPPHASDPGFSPDTLFERYGIVIAHLPQPDVPCANPPGIGTPADQEWNQAGTNLVFRFRFDCEHAEIYDAPSHLVVADLSLRRAPGNPRKDVYQGAGPISDCPGGSGKVEVDHWSPGRIDVKLEEPNSVDHLCGGIKVGHVIDALTHVDTIKISFVPRRQ